jgi:hypothetical protein
VSEAPHQRGRSAGTTTVHRDRDRLIHFAVESVISHTGLGLGRGESGPADLNACIVTTWILSGGRACEDYVRGIEQWKHLQEVALFLTETLEPYVEKAADREILIRQLRGADQLTVRSAYQRVQAAQPWRASMREDVRRSERTRQVLACQPIDDAPLMTEDDA